MNIDPNVVMAIIALSAVISPIISTYLNNKHQLKLKQIELFEKSKYEAIENFTKSLEDYYYDRFNTNVKVNFESSIANLFIYFSIPKYSLFDILRQYIVENNYVKTQFALSEIVKYLSQQINRE